jgi:hypothetical protein
MGIDDGLAAHQPLAPQHGDRHDARQMHRLLLDRHLAQQFVHAACVDSSPAGRPAPAPIAKSPTPSQPMTLQQEMHGE